MKKTKKIKKTKNVFNSNIYHLENLIEGTKRNLGSGNVLDEYFAAQLVRLESELKAEKKKAK